MILEYGFPEDYPREKVPAEVHAFMHLCRGESVQWLIDAAAAEGYEPIASKLDHVGTSIYAVALTVRGSVVPVVLRTQ